MQSQPIRNATPLQTSSPARCRAFTLVDLLAVLAAGAAAPEAAARFQVGDRLP
ncbi:MAG: hypothetical protein ACTS22_08370 [Phycisphaerales bacterium]